MRNSKAPSNFGSKNWLLLLLRRLLVARCWLLVVSQPLCPDALPLAMAGIGGYRFSLTKPILLRSIAGLDRHRCRQTHTLTRCQGHSWYAPQLLCLKVQASPGKTIKCRWTSRKLIMGLVPENGGKPSKNDSTIFWCHELGYAICPSFRHTLISLDFHSRQPLAGPLVLGYGNAETGDPCHLSFMVMHSSWESFSTRQTNLAVSGRSLADDLFSIADGIFSSHLLVLHSKATFFQKLSQRTDKHIGKCFGSFWVQTLLQSTLR